MEFELPTQECVLEMFKNLNTSKEEVAAISTKIRKWLVGQPHLPHEIDDWLIEMLAAFCKDGYDECLRRLDNYFTIRNIYPFLFSQRYPFDAGYDMVNKAICVGFMPGFTKDKCRVLVFKLIDPDPSKLCFDSLMKRSFVLVDLMMMKGQSGGYYVLVDASNSSVSHTFKVSFLKARIIAYCCEVIYPMRLKGLIFINSANIVKLFVDKILKPILKRKLVERIYVFRGDGSEQNVLPSELVPSDSGGIGPDSKEVNAYWINETHAQKDWITSRGSATSDETKRIGSSELEKPKCAVM